MSVYSTIDVGQYERVSLVQGELEDDDDLGGTKRKMVTIVGDLDEKPPEHLSLSERVKLLLESTQFQACMASCIMLNAAVIGGETDYPDLEVWSFVENAFLVIFSLELVLRLLSVGLIDFFSPGGDQLWNIFDFTIVSLGLFDFTCEALGAGGEHKHPKHKTDDSKGGQGGGVTTLFRMIRLLRILRVFKIVRFLKQLYMIFFGFVEAIQAICLVSVLMFFVLYLCSVVMVRTYGRLPLVDDKAIIVASQFKSIKTSMLSLFELMSNPGNLEIYHSSMDAYPILTLFLVAFVIFGSFGMIALLTGVISESMFDKNQTRVQELRQEREQKREVLKLKSVELFALVEKDGVGRARPTDLEVVLPYVREMFEKLDIEYMEQEFDVILSMCDLDESGTISETEFVSGILSLCDGVRAASILEVYYLVSHMNEKVRNIEKINEEVQQVSKRAIPELQRDIKKIMASLAIHPQPRSGSLKPADVHTSTNALDTSGLTQLTESHLGDIKASMASKMDEHAVLISKKIDDLNTVLISRKIDDLRAIVQDLVNGQVFTLQEAQITSRTTWVNHECPPPEPQSKSDPGTIAKGLASPASAFYKVLSAECAHGSRGHSSASGQNDNVQRSAPLSLPPAGGTAGSAPHGVMPSDPQNKEQLLRDLIK